LKYLTRANEECVTFGDETVVQNRICVWFSDSEKGVGSVVEEWGRKAAVCNEKISIELIIVSSKRPL